MGYDILANKSYIKDPPNSKVTTDIYFIIFCPMCPPPCSHTKHILRADHYTKKKNTKNS